MLNADAREALRAHAGPPRAGRWHLHTGRRRPTRPGRGRPRTSAGPSRPWAPARADRGPGAPTEPMGPGRDVVISTRPGRMPGDRPAVSVGAATPEQYHVEYAYRVWDMRSRRRSGSGWRRRRAHEVVAIVGTGQPDAPMEIATIVPKGLAAIIVLLDNGVLRRSARCRAVPRPRSASGRHTGCAATLGATDGAEVLTSPRMRRPGESGCCGHRDRGSSGRTTPARWPRTARPCSTSRPTLVGPNPPGTAWWDVPVAQVSELASTQSRPSAEHRGEEGSAVLTSDPGRPPRSGPPLTRPSRRGSVAGDAAQTVKAARKLHRRGQNTGRPAPRPIAGALTLPAPAPRSSS